MAPRAAGAGVGGGGWSRCVDAVAVEGRGRQRAVGAADAARVSASREPCGPRESRDRAGRRPPRGTRAADSRPVGLDAAHADPGADGATPGVRRSEEHTSELQSQSNLVCRLLLEKKKDTR